MNERRFELTGFLKGLQHVINFIEVRKDQITDMQIDNDNFDNRSESFLAEIKGLNVVNNFCKDQIEAYKKFIIIEKKDG